MEKQFHRLSDKIDQHITLKRFVKKSYQQWDSVTNKMNRSNDWFQGAKPVYLFELEDCMLSFSEAQVGQMLVRAMDEMGEADLINKTFKVVTNNKQGRDIRYFFNLAQPSPMKRNVEQQVAVQTGPRVEGDPGYVSPDEIPF